ncbi:response regulator [Asticcacaulis sp. AND118]|uniref:response regulator n=1 Tax=Asticcacaulis sp. AND118 TaxID=2840468 RepID=UPI001CFF7144|nr:response regulator [Asticcacaulis sp. AND118]UDF03487.1 response regulator [Asticcacaulis sp. AND118]
MPKRQTSLVPDQTGSRLMTEAEAREAALKLKAREDFFKLMSHEIRTPLNGVLGMLSLLNRTSLTAEQQSYLQTARDSGDHLLTLVNDLLDYARIEAGHIHLESHLIELEPLLQSVAELLSPRAHAGGIEIAWSLDPRLEAIEIDEGRLRQILFNLAGNALKFTTKGGVLIDVALTPQGAICFGVKDTGAGIPEEARARIFEAFGQVDPTHAGGQYGGAGLGLVVVKKLIEAMSAELDLQSEPGQGSVFTATFPAAHTLRAVPESKAGPEVVCVTGNAILAEAAQSHLDSFGMNMRHADQLKGIGRRSKTVVLADRRLLGTPLPAPNNRSLILLAPEERDEIPAWRDKGWAGYLIKPLRRSSLKERIETLSLKPLPNEEPAVTTEDDRIAPVVAPGAQVLLVEDNPVNALLAQILLQREGCRVERAASGEEALRLFEDQNSYDIVFMDLGLPGLDGIGTTQALREGGARMPIIALTANAYEEDRRACLAAGMNDFLTKPIELPALRHRLAQWCGRASSQQSPAA